MSPATDRPKTYLFPLILVTSLFFFWGFVHNLEPVLIPHLRKAFQLTDLESSLVDFSIFIAYFLMAIPAGTVMRKYGYKSGIILGLCLFASGAFLFIPAANTRAYPFFLGALFVIACGLAFLETAANPYVTILGHEQTATRRLNFSQSFNGLAAFLAPIIGGKYILSEQTLSDAQVQALSPQALEAYITQEAGGVKIPYLILGSVIVLVMLLFAFTKLPDIKRENDKEKATISDAWQHKHLRWGIAAQFFYVGAQVCVLSFFIRFIVVSAHISEKSAAFYSGIAGLAFMSGRFVGVFLMNFIKPHQLLKIYAVLSMLLTSVAVLGTGRITIYALIGVSFFMSIMFPTIFSLSIARLGKATQIASSLLIMSIVGGAILPLALGYISDITHNIQYGYIVPFICFMIVFAFGAYGWKSAANKSVLSKNNPTYDA